MNTRPPIYACNWQALIDGGLFEVEPTDSKRRGKRRSRALSSDLQIVPAYEPPPSNNWMMSAGALAVAFTAVLFAAALRK